VSIYTSDHDRHLRGWGFEAQSTWNEADEAYKHASIYMEKFKLNADKPSDMDMLAISDFLREIHEVTLSDMACNARLSHGDKDNIRYILTVPAQWSQENRDLMRELAIKAGLVSEKDQPDRLQIINESLAATLYCENEMEKMEHVFKPGFRYLICDAGGGTVDIATYEITHVENNRIERCQLTTDTSKSCGSTFLDQKMSDLLIQILFQPKRKSDYKSYEHLVSKLLNEFIKNYKVLLNYVHKRLRRA
jgi:hypothetical protein